MEIELAATRNRKMTKKALASGTNTEDVSTQTCSLMRQHDESITSKGHCTNQVSLFMHNNCDANKADMCL
jgi:hypothetical protein